MIKGRLVYFTYLVQSVGGCELIRKDLLEEADFTLSLKHQNEGWKASADPGLGKRLIRRI